MPAKKGKIIVFSAPSGGGKTTLLNYLRMKLPELVYSISATTRKPRIGEINGVHYFFFTEEEFKDRVQKDQFAEWAVVHGNYYGTPKSFIDNTINSGKNIVMDIDVFGKKKFDKFYPDAAGILILPPDLKELEKRLLGRGSENESSLRTRLENAKTEIEFAQTQGKYEYTLINDDLELAKKDILEIVISILNK
jgi:guanylate kinase